MGIMGLKDLTYISSHILFFRSCISFSLELLLFISFEKLFKFLIVPYLIPALSF